MIHNLGRHPSRTRRRMAVFIVLCLTIPSASALAFFGGFSGIVFDPSNFAENLRQAAALLEQIDRAATQIRLQRRMLAELPASVADGLRQAADGLHQQLGVSPSEPGADHGVDWSPIDSRYPLSHSGFLPAWLETMRPRWTQAERTTIAHERQFGAHVHLEMAPTSQRLAILVNASNGVNRSAARWPGEMAALQAHQELLALCSGELDKLLGLRALRARRNTTTHARQQATNAYQTSRRAVLMGNWGAASNEPPPIVRSPFGL